MTFLCHLKDVLNSRQNRSKNEMVSANSPWHKYMEVVCSGL